MNPYAVRVVLRPRNAFESLDLAAAFVRREAGALGRLSLVALLPAFVVLVAAWASEPTGWVSVLAAVLVGPLLQVPFTLLAARRLFDPNARVRDVLRAWPREIRAHLLILGAMVAALLLGLVSLGLLWIPGYVLTLFVGEVAALERLGMGAAIRRTLALASDGLGRAILGALASLALWSWTILAAELGLQSLVGFVLQVGEPFGSLIQGQPTPYLLAGILIAQPLLAVYRLLLYVDVRTAVEGWDLQVALRAASEGR